MNTDPRIEAAGFTQSPLGAAVSEVDRLRGQVAHLQDALDAIERTVGFVPKDEPLSAWVERVVKERDEARETASGLEQSLKDELRENLELFDALGFREAIDFGNDTSTNAVKGKIVTLKKERDALRQARNAALRILYGQVGNPTPSILRLRDAINELEAI